LTVTEIFQQIKREKEVHDIWCQKWGIIKA
jgi:hypothetical protein